MTKPDDGQKKIDGLLKAELEKISSDPLRGEKARKILARMNAKMNKELEFDSYRYMMQLCMDHPRFHFYKTIIDHHVKDKKVLEIGCGAGLLSLLCFSAGAKSYVGCDFSERWINLTKKLLQDNFPQESWDLFIKDSAELTLEETGQVDVIVHELFSNDGLKENILETLKDAKRFIGKNGIITPRFLNIWFTPFHAQLPTPKWKAPDHLNSYKTSALEEYFSHMSPQEPLVCFTQSSRSIFSFDFHSDYLLQDEVMIDYGEKILGGLIHFTISDAGVELHSNGPQSHWSPRPIYLERPAQKVIIGYDRNQIFLKEGLT